MTPLLFSAYCSTGVTGYAYTPVCCYRPPPRRCSSSDVQCSLVLVSGGSMSLVFVKQGRNAAVLVAVGVCLFAASGITETVQMCSWRRARVLMRCVPRWRLGCRVGSVRLCHGRLCVWWVEKVSTRNRPGCLRTGFRLTNVNICTYVCR